MTLNEIKTLFSSIITESSWWTKFKGSEFITYIVTFVAQVYFRANQLSARRLQEAFLSLALKTSSILAHAESRGYVARKRVPTKIKIDIENSSGSTKSIPENTALFSSDNNLYYLITEALSVAAGETLTAYCIQGQIEYFSDSVDSTQKYLTKSLDAATSEAIAELKVFIEDTAGNEEQWTASYMFRNADADSQVYVEYYSAEKQLGIRFGNGISGAIPELDSTITLECITTEGFSEIAAGQALTFEDDDSLNDSLTVTTGDTLVVGSAQEEIETLRSNALYHTSYDNTVIFDNDYSYFTRRNIPGLTWFRVWGEKEQETLMGAANLDYIGKVYLSAYHPDITQEAMLESIADLYATVNMLNIEYEPVQCSEAPFTIDVSATILSSNSAQLVETVVRDSLSSAFSSSAADHDGQITYNAIWKNLEALNVLTSFNITVNADLDTQPDIDTFRYLDVDNSTINITY